MDTTTTDGMEEKTQVERAYGWPIVHLVFRAWTG